MKIAAKKRKGFTLIELIVVIIILGILAAIAVPRMMNVTDTAQEAANKATARTIVSAIVVASANYDGEIEQVTVEEVNKMVDVEVVGSETEDKWSYKIEDGEIYIYFGDGNDPVYSPEEEN